MAKKNGLNIGMMIGSIVVGAAAGVFYYYKKNELKKLADDIIARVRLADGTDDEPGDWDISGAETDEAEDVNIVDSGVSLESVEAETEAETDGEAAEEAEPEAEADEDEDDDIERPKKPWFWSK